MTRSIIFALEVDTLHILSYTKNRTVCPFAVGKSNGRNTSHVTMPTVCDVQHCGDFGRFRTSTLHQVGVYASHMF